MPRPCSRSSSSRRGRRRAGYINQTSCVSGPCLTNGALQTITVDCSATTTLTNALAQIADRNGPNVINVSGTCPERFTNINGFNRLTIQGNPSATFTLPAQLEHRQLALSSC